MARSSPEPSSEPLLHPARTPQQAVTGPWTTSGLHHCSPEPPELFRPLCPKPVQRLTVPSPETTTHMLVHVSLCLLTDPGAPCVACGVCPAPRFSGTLPPQILSLPNGCPQAGTSSRALSKHILGTFWYNRLSFLACGLRMVTARGSRGASEAAPHQPGPHSEGVAETACPET